MLKRKTLLETAAFRLGAMGVDAKRKGKSGKDTGNAGILQPPVTPRVPRGCQVHQSLAAGPSLLAICFPTTSTKTQTFRQTDPSLPPGCF